MFFLNKGLNNKDLLFFFILGGVFLISSVVEGLLFLSVIMILFGVFVYLYVFINRFVINWFIFWGLVFMSMGEVLVILILMFFCINLFNRVFFCEMIVLCKLIFRKWYCKLLMFERDN